MIIAAPPTPRPEWIERLQQRNSLTPTPSPVSELDRPAASPTVIPSSMGKPAGTDTEVEVSLGTPIRLKEHGGFDQELSVTSADQGAINVVVGDLTRTETRLTPGSPGRVEGGSYVAGNGSYSYRFTPTRQVSVPRRASFSGQRQLIFEDPAGAKVYFVEALSARDGCVRLVIERGRGGLDTINLNRNRPVPGLTPAQPINNRFPTNQ